MPNFKILMKWTQKGLDEIDKVHDRREFAKQLMLDDFPLGASQVVFRNSGTHVPDPGDIVDHPGNKSAHVVWRLTAANRDLVVQLANAFAFHGRVNTIVRPD
jgi:hypothetical protein